MFLYHSEYRSSHCHLNNLCREGYDGLSCWYLISSQVRTCDTLLMTFQSTNVWSFWGPSWVVFGCSSRDVSLQLAANQTHRWTSINIRPLASDVCHFLKTANGPIRTQRRHWSVCKIDSFLRVSFSDHVAGVQNYHTPSTWNTSRPLQLHLLRWYIHASYIRCLTVTILHYVASAESLTIHFEIGHGYEPIQPFCSLDSTIPTDELSFKFHMHKCWNYFRNKRIRLTKFVHKLSGLDYSPR